MTKPTISAFSELAPLLIQKYERYLPTAFDESMSILQKVNKVIQRLEDLGLLVGSIGSQWNEVMEWVMNEGLNESVIAKLDQMVLDGTFDEIINETILGNKVGKGDLVVSVKDYGAIGDGITDDTISIQNAIDFVRDQGGGKILIPTGTFLISSSLILYSNIEITGNGKATKLVKNNRGYVFQVLGSIGTENALSADKTSGDKVITTVNPHGLSKNDLVLITSQRSAFSTDTPEHWRMGGATGGTNASYFGEFLLVYSVDSSYQFTSTAGLLYPFYYKDMTRETTVGARPSATIQKVTPVKDVVISNMRITGDIAGAINVEYGYNVITKDIDGFIETSGSFIVFRNSFKCHDENSRVVYSVEFDPETHYDRNPFKVISSHDCGFIGSYGEYATQTFDFTFQDYSIISTHPFYKDGGSSFSDLNAGTSHGGVYGAIITGNRFTNCVQYGLSVRARNAIVSNNFIQGTRGGTYSYGVAIYEGFACDCIVSNNQIADFNKGITHIDGSDESKFFKWMGTQIFGNVMKNVNRGFIYEKNASNTYSGRSGLSIIQNEIGGFYGEYAKAVILSGVNHATVAFNTFYDPDGNTNAGVYISKTGTENIILNNEFNGITAHIWVQDDLESSIRLIYDTNKTFTTSNIILPATGVSTSKLIHGSQHPLIDNKIALGWSGARYSTVYSVATYADRFIIPNSGTSGGINNTLFVDSSDNKLKFRDSTGSIKTVTLV